MKLTTGVPDWLLERHALGELSDEEREALERRIEVDEELQKRLAAIERDNEAILAHYPAADMAREIELRRHRQETAKAVAARGRRWTAGKGFGLLTALAGATVIVMLAQPVSQEDDIGGMVDVVEVTRAKGQAEIFIHRVGAARQEAVAAGDLARAGDVLQVSYRTPEARYAVIVSVDGRGTVTVHFPATVMAGALSVGSLTELDHSYELDDAPGFECFFFVTAPDPFAVQLVLDAAAALTPSRMTSETTGVHLSLPAELEQTSLLVRKASR